MLTLTKADVILEHQGKHIMIIDVMIELDIRLLE